LNPTKLVEGKHSVIGNDTIINWRIKCRTEYVNTSKHHNSNGMGHHPRIPCGHTQWRSIKHPGGIALTTGLLHMGIKWKTWHYL